MTFIHICSELGIRIPEVVVKSLGETTWSDIKALGGKVILQLRRGHAGETSFTIEKEEDLKRVHEAYEPTHKIKLSQFLDGKTLTVNCEITDGGLTIGHLMEQITGIPMLNTSPLGTCGVCIDTQIPVPEELKDGIRKLGSHMAKNGYKGVFGVDALLTKEGEIYFIECNARFTATISYYTQLEYEKDLSRTSQIILRNTKDHPVKIHHRLTPGIYEVSKGKLKKKSDSLYFSDLSDESEILILTRPSGSIVNPGLETAFVQSKSFLVQGTEPDGRIHAVLSAIDLRPFISPENFWKEVSGGVKLLADVFIKPLTRIASMSERARARNRQTQLLPDEPPCKILGEKMGFFLIQKDDGSMGWVEKEKIEKQHSGKASGSSIPAVEFLKRWKGTQYSWGGLTDKGIDCSGFIQRFFLETKGVKIPKHTQDQRKLGQEIGRESLTDGDIIFLEGKKGENHVALYHQGLFWHASRKRGEVVAEKDGVLEMYYKITECRRIGV